MIVLPIRKQIWRVGDVVRVGRAILDNPPDSIAVVVEVYDRRALRIGAGIGVTLLFRDGSFDGFSPDDLDACHVERVAHNPAVAGYSWVSAIRLIHDWTNGRFDMVWATHPTDYESRPITLRPRMDTRSGE